MVENRYKFHWLKRSKDVQRTACYQASWYKAVHVFAGAVIIRYLDYLTPRKAHFQVLSVDNFGCTVCSSLSRASSLSAVIVIWPTFLPGRAALP